MNLNKKIVALSVSAATVATLAFSTIGPASAAVPTDAVTSGVCTSLTTSVSSLLSQITAENTAATTAAADLAAKKLAVPAAVTALSGAVTGYVQALATNVGVTTATQVLVAANSVFADKIVAENDAMTASFEAQRGQYLSGLNQGYLNNVNLGLCGVALPV